MSISIFIFRRDFRIIDNTSLQLLLKSKEKILPIFIFNKKQIDRTVNKYYSENCVEFMFQSLNELSPINYYYTTDNDITILNDLKKRFNIGTIAFNKDYTPFAINRDKLIIDWCNDNKIKVITEEDYTLLKIGTVLKDGKTPYVKFTPFYKKTILNKPPAILNNSYNSTTFIKDSKSKSLDYYKKFFKIQENPNLNVKGGRSNVLPILKKIKDNYFKDYDKERDYPYLDKTTKLSAYIKFGCVSIREIYFSVSSPYSNGIIRELIWHDFYANITYYFPYIFGKPFLKKYTDVKWDTNNDFFEKWKEGKTGFPLIDAGMRQLNTTGWLHNRIRMLVACFLTKNLYLDWQLGENYFATKLIDYDPSSNNGGWQWSGSVGTDAMPYFRIFAPMLQLAKFDKDCLYVKKWVPELRDVDKKIILKWETDYNKYPEIKYYKPMVDIKKTSKEFVERFKKYK
jgi:deoxyribodipyrimidine photo-lyase